MQTQEHTIQEERAEHEPNNKYQNQRLTVVNTTNHTQLNRNTK